MKFFCEKLLIKKEERTFIVLASVGHRWRGGEKADDKLIEFLWWSWWSPSEILPRKNASIFKTVLYLLDNCTSRDQILALSACVIWDYHSGAKLSDVLYLEYVEPSSIRAPFYLFSNYFFFGCYCRIACFSPLEDLAASLSASTRR